MAGEEILCTIMYLENSDKSRYDYQKKRVENYYVLNKSEYPRTLTEVYSLHLNYQNNYNSNGNSQYNKFSNQIMFAQRGKTGDNEGGVK